MTALPLGSCPKCGSGAYTPSGCVVCGHQPYQVVRVVAVAPAASPVEGLAPAWGTRTDRAPTTAEAATSRRLEAAWREEDTVLDGREPMPDPEKVYRCKECEETFPSPQALAGHVNHHRHQARLKAKEAEGALSGTPRAKNRPHRAPPENGGGLCCPLCVQPLSPEVQVLVDQFTVEGVDEELAVKLAAKAYGLLRVS